VHYILPTRHEAELSDCNLCTSVSDMTSLHVVRTDPGIGLFGAREIFSRRAVATRSRLP
jgi:hypothetical protein